MSNIEISGKGIGFGGLLFIVLLVLKVTQTVGWSWWIITAPIRVPVLVVVVVLVLLGMFAQWVMS